MGVCDEGDIVNVHGTCGNMELVEHKVVRFDANDCLIVNRSLEGKSRAVNDSGDGLISSGLFDGSTLLLPTVRFEDVEEETITRFFRGINVNDGERAREGRVLVLVWGTGAGDIGNGTNGGNELVEFGIAGDGSCGKRMFVGNGLDD
ncbi:unnamed protein product [Didymodactylos carnosus]|uniref:Uncharacterized protein n=1 Tax=Didymodactylos carnosus TaxID=1234261 RepID=A0A816E1Z9_9BILA|nr:unnamed protein product [Didymodactylos carnosus]CAF4558284.1 unnamed protein product [Didymodactylos carnosus]